MNYRSTRSFSHAARSIFLLALVSALAAGPLSAQSGDSNQPDIQPLRSDVGLNGITANFHWLSNLTYKGNDSLQYDGTSELEIELRNVRMMSPRVGVGFQVLTSFFTGGDKSFGIGSWGAGPVIRGYPLKSEQWQPYLQADALFGNNLAVGRLANTGAVDGFRVRLGLHGGLAYRISNRLGFFLEGGWNWESDRLFKSDARVLQINIGVDLYRFN